MRAKLRIPTYSQIHRAAQNPVELDWQAAEAVDCRIELDLRLGAAFTRLQCNELQAQHPSLNRQLMSYGKSPASVHCNSSR
jgi:DNA topoisomerase-3